MSTLNKKHIILASVVSILLILFLVFLIVLSGQSEKKVTITSSPSSSDFKIGDIKGKTPATVSLKSGKYELEISQKDYKTIKTSFSIAPLKKEVKLNYTLEILPPEVIGTGGGYIQTPTEVQKTVNAYKTKFPFASLLPVQTKTYYISAPYDDGTINVYLFKETEQQGKEGAYQWFKDHGVANPQSLNIKWKYNKP